MSTQSRYAGGRIREVLMPSDVKIRCKIPHNRDVFDSVIEGVRNDLQGGSRKRHLAAVAEAKRVCRECPVIAECLAVHGQDLELGVVGGLTGAERATRFGIKPPEAVRVRVKPTPITHLAPPSRQCSRCGGLTIAISDETRALNNLVRVLERRPGTPQAESAKTQIVKIRRRLDDHRANIAGCCG